MKTIFMLDGKPHEPCDCDPWKGPCKLGRERVGNSAQLPYCVVPCDSTPLSHTEPSGGHQHRRNAADWDHCLICGDALPSDFTDREPPPSTGTKMLGEEKCEHCDRTVFLPYVKPDNPGGTHWDDCWRAHHACAIHKIESAPSATRRNECPYCTSENPAIRDTYYDQTCEGCVKRMGRP